MRTLERIILVALIAMLGTFFVLAVKDATHERELRRHACHELELAGADADSAADVEACTFDG